MNNPRNLFIFIYLLTLAAFTTSLVYPRGHKQTKEVEEARKAKRKELEDQKEVKDIEKNQQEDYDYRDDREE